MRYPTSLLIVCGLASGLTTAAIAQCDRDAVLADYADRVTATRTFTADIGWTGSTETCTPGTVSELAREHALTRINYYRDRVGLGPVAYDDELNARAQEAALMMHAQRALNHYPGTDFACYTEVGAEAAAKSNLGLRATGSKAVTAYMRELGAGNESVGHRRWILYTRGKTVGQGFTSNADAMWVIGNHGPSTLTGEYIAWPTPGINPAPDVPQRWSFSIPAADFEDATVSVTDAYGTEQPITVHPVVNGYGDNTLVWEVAREVVYSNTADVSYTVSIANVGLEGERREYSYTVTVSSTNQAQDCGAGLAWSDTDCACRPVATSVREAWASVQELRGAVDVELYDLAGRLLDRQQGLTAARLDLRALASARSSGMVVAVVHEQSTGRRASVRVMAH